MTLDDLLVREEIKQLKARYCLHIDLKQWDEYAALFASDATMNVDTAVTTRGGDPQALPEVRGRAAIRAYIADLLAEAVTVHQCHTPVIEVTSPTTASAIWAMEDDVEMSGFHLHARGHYRETYVVEDGQWRIATLHLTRTRIDMLEGLATG